ncbi:hypothetical protein LPW11_06930 [Geomonas sp. RF6]|nr:hypothetical protein [Geomonas sp. RF6]UFS71919.1 hypothetical protein LPW11_06930 [Geomonas sp. RF6]
MTALFLFIVAIVAILLTLWLLLIPAGVVAGSFRALRHGGRKGARRG